MEIKLPIEAKRVPQPQLPTTLFANADDDDDDEDNMNPVDEDIPEP